jgi:hypothetical protein
MVVAILVVMVVIALGRMRSIVQALEQSRLTRGPRLEVPRGRTSLFATTYFTVCKKCKGDN